jgi:hypothetical protein
MALPSVALPWQCPDPYRRSVPRLPKNFEIAWVSIEHLEPVGYLASGPETAVPTHFEAHFQLSKPEASVTIEIFVGGDLRPVVIELMIRSKARTPITTSVLRQVLVDQLLRKALDEATVPSTVREEWLTSLPRHLQPPAPHDVSPSLPSRPANKRTRGQSDADAETAARIYSEAVAAGSRSPAVSVAVAMDRSRAQAARYIRRARALGLLPPLESPEGA